MTSYSELLRVEARLPRRFVEVVRSVGVTEPISCVLDHFDLLARKYCEAPRHYHTLTHIAQCIIEFDRVAQYAKHPNRILMAIFYHDVVYDTSRNDNEQKSASYFSMNARNVLHITDEEFIIETARLIELTKVHRTDPNTDPDGALMCDVDMSILGADAFEYDEYARTVRKEYAKHGDEHWAVVRMEHFIDPKLEDESIFLTPMFRARYEERARANLMEERMRLQS